MISVWQMKVHIRPAINYSYMTVTTPARHQMAPSSEITPVEQHQVSIVK